MVGGKVCFGLLIVQILLLASRNARVNAVASCGNYLTESTCTTTSADRCEWDADLRNGTCVCASTQYSDIVFIMDSSGSMGRAGWKVEKGFIVDLLETAIPTNSTIGIVRFASFSEVIHNLTSFQNRDKMTDLVTNMSYTRGYTFTAEGVKDALNMFTTQTESDSDRDKLLVLITDGVPQPQIYSPCNWTELIWAADIYPIVISAGFYSSDQEVDCLLHNPEQDMVSIGDKFTEAAFDIAREFIEQYVCGAMFDIRLSEVKPVPGSAVPVPFVEYWNNGQNLNLSAYDLVLDGIFSGVIRSEDIIFAPNYTDSDGNRYGGVRGDVNWGDTVWYEGQYLVIFDNSATATVDPQCHECICDKTATTYLCYDAIYLGCDGTNCQYNSKIDDVDVSPTYWFQDMSENSTTVNISNRVTYDTDDWVKSTDDYPYEVVDIENCYTPLATCWQVSCTPYGTPGDAPVACSTDCYDVVCQVNDDTTAYCPQNGTCVCTPSDGYYLCGASCCKLEAPTNCTAEIYAQNKSASSYKGEIVYVTWSRIDVSGASAIAYHVTYYDTDGILTAVTTYTNTRFAYLKYNLQLGSTSNPIYVAGYINDNGANVYSDYLLCPITTDAPTSEPTLAPTFAVPPVVSCWVIVKAGVPKYGSANWVAANTSYPQSYSYIDGYRVVVYQHDQSTAEYTVSVPSADTVYNSTYIHQHFTNGVQYYDIYVQAWVGSCFECDDSVYSDEELCRYITHAPTREPTNVPTFEPTDRPTLEPTYKPTQSPTYAKIVLSNCVVTIDAGTDDDWTISWNETDPDDGPADRQIIMYINEDQEAIINDDSPHAYTNKQLDVWTDNVTIAVRQFYLSEAPELVQGSEIDCIFVTYAPTFSPTAEPTPSPTTPQPTMPPTAVPSYAPTPSPTYDIHIEWCLVTLLEFDDDEAVWTTILLTFTVPTFDPPLTPDENDVRYALLYETDLNEVFNKDYTSGANVSETLVDRHWGVNGTAEMTVIDKNDASIQYGTTIECRVVTQAPSPAPTYDPTLRPTAAPTYQPPGVYVTNILCTCSDSGCERCDCSEDLSDFSCVGVGVDLGENSYAENENAQTIRIAKYPSDYPVDIYVNWTFAIYTNISETEERLSDWDPTSDDIYPWTEVTTFKKQDSVTDLSIFFTADDLYEGAEDFIFIILGCWIDPDLNENSANGELAGQNCSAIYPYRFPLTITESDAALLVNEEYSPVADWIWYFLLGGVAALLGLGYGAYTFFKNKHLAAEEARQNEGDAALIQNVGPQDLDATMMQGNPAFNPMAAGAGGGGDVAADHLSNLQANPEFVDPGAERMIHREENF